VKLKKIVLDNFRCFEHLEMEFDERLTVIVGTNGAGKTAALDSIAVLFGRFLTCLPGVTGIRPKLADLRVFSNGKLAPAFRCYIEADATAEIHAIQINQPEIDLDASLEWSSGKLRDNSPGTASQAIKMLDNSFHKNTRFFFFGEKIDHFADKLVEAETQSEPYRMPLIVYYGTGRAVFDTPMRRRNFKTHFTRFDSLSDALKPSVSFKHAFEWFHTSENEENRELKKRQSLKYTDPGLDCVRRAITQFFSPQFQNPRTELRPLRFVVDWKDGDHYIPLDLNQLSDGYRTTLALVADLARRMVEANPPGCGIDDPLNAEAIVLIDEVDLHLHPAWQQRILAQLQETFPKSQFIVTTHSPQVLSTVPAECIRVLHTATDPETQATRATVSTVKRQTLGVASSDVLAEVMGIDPVPDVEQARDLQSYHALIQQNLHETPDGLKLRDKLTAHFGVEHPAMLECDRLIRLQSFKRKLPARAE
jgi:predicted ATP-binding protein involved in virulence